MATTTVKGTAVQKAPVTLKALVEAARDDIAAVLPAHMDVDRVIRGVRLAIAQNPDLEKCDPKTVLFSVMAAAAIGLEVNSPLQYAWLIPYKTECTLQIGYRGYQDLARRGGGIRHVEARVVFEGDTFEYRYGTDPKIVHTPGSETDPAKLTHAYAIAFPKDGGAPIFDVLTAADVERARASSRMREGDTWKKHTAEMWRKTAVRRLAKYLPLSPEMAAAIEMDLRGETGEVHSVTPLIDSPASLNARAATETASQLEALKAKMGGTQAATPPAPSADAPGPKDPAPQPASTEAPAW